MSSNVQPLLPGMKVTIKGNLHLGVGQVLFVELDPILHYKVKFPNSPVKGFYPHEIQRFTIPRNSVVQTRYGTGLVIGQLNHATENELYFYEIKFVKAGITKSLPEDFITRTHPGFWIPCQRDKIDLVTLREVGIFLNGFHFRYCLPSNPRYQAACHGRIEIFPHQMSVVNQVLSSYPPRFLLCDEVGLGKTIETCAILKELLLRDIIHRCIIVVPANLVSQWHFELESKFNLDFIIYDGNRLKVLRDNYPGLNPWTMHDRIITSIHFARRDEHRKALDDVFFDLAIFDEAHHLRRYNTSTGRYMKTKNYELGEILARNSRFLLLLTATPMQLNPFELFSLIQLVDPVLFPKYSDFLEFKEKVSDYNYLIRNYYQFSRLNVFERRSIIKQAFEILNQEGIKIDPHRIQVALANKDPDLFSKIVNILREKHLLSKVLIRNKKKLVFKGKIPKRNIKIILVEPLDEEKKVYNAIRQYIIHVYQRSIQEKNNALGFLMVIFQKLLTSSQYALLKTIEKRISFLRERQIKLLDTKLKLERSIKNGEGPIDKILDKINSIDIRILQIDEDVPILKEYYKRLRNLKHDSKGSTLINLIQERIKEEPELKLIIFTQFIRTLYYLKDFIEQKIPGVETGVFHGKLGKKEKQMEIDRFKFTTGKPFILISTEAGGEGRNFQFCNEMINYDLPWNPVKLEQRIGRIDRIGQTRDINIYNL
ncbi:MAG: DEAD/DEAH box helicase, partial [Promethearchaeota archaeon]